MSAETPSGHALDCAYHLDQYSWECTCGLTSGATNQHKQAAKAAPADEAGLREAISYLTPHERTADHAAICLTAGKMREAVAITSRHLAAERERANRLCHVVARTRDDMLGFADRMGAAIEASELPAGIFDRALADVRATANHLIAAYNGPEFERTSFEKEIDRLSDEIVGLRRRALAAEAALAAERERCALVCDQSAKADREAMKAGDLDRSGAMVAILTAREIAKAIRSRSTQLLTRDAGGENADA